MSEIDIRKTNDVEITKIRFADGEQHNTRSCTMSLEKDRVIGNYVYMEDFDGDCSSRVMLRDIDNLILALQKAKELLTK